MAPNTVPQYVALADTEIHVASNARITLRPLVQRTDDSMVPLGPYLRLSQNQTRTLAADLVAAADQSAEDSGQRRH